MFFKNYILISLVLIVSNIKISYSVQLLSHTANYVLSVQKINKNSSLEGGEGRRHAQHGGPGTKSHDGPEHEPLCRMASMVNFEDYAKPAAVPAQTVLAGGVESDSLMTSLKRALLLLAQAVAEDL